MSGAPVLSCPKCKRAVGALDWFDANGCRCLFCREDFRFVPFPALTKTADVAKPQAVVVADDSTCFFHAENQAEKVCDSCGRFLCSVCSVPFAGNILCPTCISTKKKTDEKIITERPLYDLLALILVIGPLVPVISFFLTAISAPWALAIVITKWKKPRSLVWPGRTLLIIAGLLALIEIGAWAFIILKGILKP